MTIKNVWYAAQKFKSLERRKMLKGSLHFFDHYIKYTSEKNDVILRKLTKVARITLPGDFVDNYIEVSFIDYYNEAKTIYLSGCRLHALGFIFGNRPLLAALQQFKKANQMSADVVIITPIEVEYNALTKLLKEPKSVKGAEGTYYLVGKVTNKYGSLSIALTNPGSGLRPTAVNAMETARLFTPKVMLLVGVAGGIKQVKLGDLLICDSGLNYECGKQYETHFAPRPDFITYSYKLVQYAQEVVRKNTWKHSIGPLKLFKKNLIGVHTGPIVCGEKVIGSQQSALALFIKKQFSSALAVEMEATGLIDVMNRYREIHLLNIRAISDLLSDKSKTDGQGTQEEVMLVLCAYLTAFLKGLDLVSL